LEVSVGWVDVGCGPIRGFPSYAVAVTLRPTRAEDGTTVQQAKPGERMHFKLGGKPYTMAVEQAVGPGRDGKSCGSAYWMLYRDDFLIREQ
jgi:hypothetical protein